jgi:tetratricopeptide (TPR) repeat protein
MTKVPASASIADTTAFLAESLYAHCLGVQNREAEAVARLERQVAVNPTVDLRLLLGRLYVRQGRWNEAGSALLVATGELTPDTRPARQAAALLLPVADGFSGKGDLIRCFACLAASVRLYPQNPLLASLFPNLAEDRPILFFLAGDYGSAIDGWEEQVKRDGYGAQRVHSLAVAHQCRLESPEPLEPEERLRSLDHAYMFWTALSRDSDYWEGLYRKRQPVYGADISRETFLQTTPETGITRCHARLPGLREEWERTGNTGALERLGRVQKRMSLERHSGELLSEIRSTTPSEWPPGGFGFLSFLWGPEKRDKALGQLAEEGAGSPSWLIKGLHDDGMRDPFLRFLDKDYDGCLAALAATTDPKLADLRGLAHLRKAEAAMEAGTYEGCREMAAALPDIPDAGIREKVRALLDERAGHRVRAILQRGRRDEAIDFLSDILAKAENEGEGRLPQSRIQLASLYLQRGEARFHGRDLDGFVADFQAAGRLSADPTLCDNKLQQVVWHHINEKMGTKTVRSAQAFIERMNRTFPSNFLTAMTKVCNALIKVETGAPIGDKRVVMLLKEAHDFAPNDIQLKKLISLSLTDNAVISLNSLINAFKEYPTKEGRIWLVERLDGPITTLQKALQLDPGNNQAQTNLMDVIKMKAELVTMG